MESDVKILTLTMPNFLNGIIYIPFFGTSHYHFFWDKMKNLKLVSHQYRARLWSDCMDVQAGLALITSGVGRVRVKIMSQ